MKKNLYNLFFVSTIIMIIILSFLMLGLLLEQRKNEKDNKNNKELELVKSENLITNLYLKQNIQEAIVNDNLYVRLYPKDSLNNGKPVLVFRYSALNCNECIEFGNRKLAEFFNDYRINQNLLFISSDYNLGEQTHNIRHFDLKKERLGLPVEYSNQPFFFILENDQVKHMFIPDKKYSECTDIYLYEIRKRYFLDKIK